MSSSQLFILSEENRSVQGARWIRLATEKLQVLRCFPIADGTRLRPLNPVYLEEVAAADAIVAANVVAIAAGNQPAPVPPITADPNGEPVPPVPIPPNSAAAIREAYYNDRKYHYDVLKMLKDERREYDDLQATGLQVLFEFVDESFKTSIPLNQRNTLHDLWTSIIQKVNQRSGTELAHRSYSYHNLKQQKGQSLETYRFLRKDYEESLDNAGLPVPAQIQKSSFLSSLLPLYRNSSDIYHDNAAMNIDQCLQALKGLELRVQQNKDNKIQTKLMARTYLLRSPYP